jgi:hypothetical protein
MTHSEDESAALPRSMWKLHANGINAMDTYAGSRPRHPLGRRTRSNVADPPAVASRVVSETVA